MPAPASRRPTGSFATGVASGFPFLSVNNASVDGLRGYPFPGGAAYSAAKHGVVAMSHTINMEECVNGIRSCVVCPGEVATPILDKRPIPITPAERKRMAQSEDVGDLIRYVACLPAHVVINEVMINPTWNRGYVGALQRAAAEKAAKTKGKK